MFILIDVVAGIKINLTFERYDDKIKKPRTAGFKRLF